MWKKALAVILVLVLCVSVMWVSNPLVPAYKASADTFRSGFSIVPEKEDDTGVSLDSGFILGSQTEIDLDYVKANVTMREGETLIITPAANGKFLLKPSEPLKQNQVYFIDVKAQDGRTVSFAFQTKRDFTVLGSLPDKMSANVPVDTGIEMYFSYPDVKDISKYFEISPKVDGRFENNGYTTVFIPKKLEAGTLYTVKIKKGLSATKGAVSLNEDYVFSFETSADQNSTADPFPGSIFMNDTWIEFGSTEKPAIPFDLYMSSNPASADVTLKVYQFKTLDDFTNAIREKEKAPSWAPYAMSKSMIETSDLNKIVEFKQNFNLQKWQSKYMMFPETLAEGFYLVELSCEKLSAQAFMQISDISAYTVSDKGNTLFWLNNLKSGTPVKDAEVVYQNTNVVPKDQKTLKTDSDGLVKLPIPKKDGNGDWMTQDLYKVTSSDGKVSLINTGYSYDYTYGKNNTFYYQPYSEGLYWRYIQTDRTLYKPNDTAQFWGYIKSRVDGSTPEEVTVELASGGYYYPMKSNIMSRFMPAFLSNPLETFTLKTEGGFYEGRVNLPALDPGSYTITVKDGDEVLSSSYFSVENYIKPQYKLEISSDKKAVFVGDKVTFTLKASFFDGTPVSNVPLNYSINGFSKTDQGKGVTDINGVLKVEYTPTYESNMQGECYYGINVSAQFPETGEISEYYNFRVFANNITFRPQGEIKDNKGVISLTVNTVKLGTLNDDDLTNDNYIGAPIPAHNLSLSLYRITWEKIETGDEYDAINKVVRKTYEYREKRIAVGNTKLITNQDGTARYEFPVKEHEDGYYIAEITTKDKNNHKLKSDVWLYRNGIGGIGYPQPYEYYTLKADKENYKANETVKVEVLKNDEQPLKDMRTLFVEARNGIQGYQVKNQPTLSQPFKEDYAPNYYLEGIVFTGKTYIQTNSTIVYDYSEKKLNLEIKTDKTSYKPGENMTITIKATDIDGKSAKAKVNLSLVDEALLKLSGQYIDPLAQLYTWIESGLTRATSSRSAGYGRETGAMLTGFATYDTANVKMESSKGAPQPSAEPAPARDEDAAAATVRSDFKDTALFKTLTLDENGLGTYTFKLPDNITSFSLAATAVSSDLFAGSDIQSAKVSMPFFINDALSMDYLVGDKPYVGVTAYGESLTENENVTFELTIKELANYKQTATAKAFQRVNLALPTMTEGTYTVVLTAKSETGKTDALSRTITVYPSYRTIETASLKNLVPGMKMDAGKSGITTLIITDAGRGSLINSLHGLSWDYGKRLDQKLVSNYARKLLKEVIKNENYSIDPIDIQPSEYKNEDGGYGILPYAGSDMTFTALITPLLKDVADANALKMYFYNAILSDKKVQASALYALAELGEPMLLDLNRAAATENLAIDDYLFLGMAYEALGDLSTATDIYQKNIAPNLERKDPYIRVKVKNSDTDTSYAQTALAAAFASRIDSPDAAKLFAYVQNNYSKTKYIGVEKILYLEDQMKKLPDTTASFEYNMGGKTYTSNLDNGRSEVIKVPSINIGQLKVSNVTGNVSVLSLYTKSYTENVKNDAGLTMTRKYYNADTGKETTTFAPNDLVKVEISYKLDKTAIDNTYEISDYAPAGLKPLDNPWSYGVKDMMGCWYRQFDGQKVTFVVGKSNEKQEPLVYYARVASPGEYVAEGTVAQGSMVKTSIVTLKDDRIIINP